MNSQRSESTDEFGTELEKLASELTDQVKRAKERFREEVRLFEARSFAADNDATPWGRRTSREAAAQAATRQPPPKSGR
jgi:hypothetical protein